MLFYWKDTLLYLKAHSISFCIKNLSDNKAVCLIFKQTLHEKKKNTRTHVRNSDSPGKRGQNRVLATRFLR